MMRWCIPAFVIVAIATPATAQSTYVGASLVGDVARFSRIDFDNAPGVLRNQLPDDASALGFNVKIGRTLGERWGVEFEFARSGEMESHLEHTVPFSVITLPGVPPPSFSRPDFTLRFDQEQQHTGFGAIAWFRQDLGDRVDISYLGGVVFSRWHRTQTHDVTILWPAIFPPPARTVSTTTYGITPAVGAEVAIKFSERAAVTTGLRVQGITGQGGWLLRPNAGFRWMF